MTKAAFELLKVKAANASDMSNPDWMDLRILEDPFTVSDRSQAVPRIGTCQPTGEPISGYGFSEVA